MKKYFAVIIPALSLCLLGNKGCEEKKDSRILRMDVALGAIRTLPLKVNDQDEILIDQLNRDLFSRSIYNHDHFTIVTTSSAPQALQTNDQVTPQNHFSETDSALLGRYGFQLHGEQLNDALTTNGEVPRCEWETPQLTLDSDVLGFELVNRNGIGVGYTPTGTHFDRLRGRINFNNFRLDYGITASDPLLNRTVAKTETVGYKSSVEVTFDFGQDSLFTVDFFYQEALVKVIREGMKKSLDALLVRLGQQTAGAGKDWNKNIWESRVLFDPVICETGDCIAIRGGRLNRIKEGDVFNVTNMIYSWEGEPCNSNLRRSIPDKGSQRLLTIDTVGDAVAVGHIIKGDVDIQPGAQVQLNHLALDPKANKN